MRTKKKNSDMKNDMAAPVHGSSSSVRWSDDEHTHTHSYARARHKRQCLIIQQKIKKTMNKNGNKNAKQFPIDRRDDDDWRFEKDT